MHKNNRFERKLTHVYENGKGLHEKQSFLTFRTKFGTRINIYNLRTEYFLEFFGIQHIIHSQGERNMTKADIKRAVEKTAKEETKKTAKNAVASAKKK